jgi:nitrate/TMAO reductase-like tetraheme cytochrome c subunit
VSIAGGLITTLAAFAFITYFTHDAFGLFASPYAGLFGIIVIPAFFILGLALIPLGIQIESRRRRAGHMAWRWPPIDLSDRRTRTVLMTVLLLTLVNLVIVTIASVSAVHYMETNAFCGQVCHEPMEPQFTALPLSSHAKLHCVDCHVAPGAAGMVAAKLNGTRQLWELATNSYARPIPSPRSRIPSTDVTCLRCHTPASPDLEEKRVYREHKDNETSDPILTTLQVYTGKIHWHARPDVMIEYVATDDTLGTIPYVKATVGGLVTEYFAEDVTTPPAGQPVRRMDCLDCHNRPAHTLASTPQQVVDRAINAGEVSRSVPSVRSEMVDALLEEHPAGTDVARAIGERLSRILGTSPDAQKAIAVTQRVYRENVFPRMNITWGTFKNNLFHIDDGGCFRCHSDIHTAKADPEIKIRQDCELCHKEQ